MSAPHVAFDRFVHTGNAVIDLVLSVPQLPERGGDVLSTHTTSTTGGAFNVMAAASRLGLHTVYAGAHGTGPHGDTVRHDLAAEGIDIARPPEPDIDTGFVVALVDASGERTFVTSAGAEARLLTLADIAITDRDAVHVSGYTLAFDLNRRAVLSWLDGLDAGATVLFDPGPLVRDRMSEEVRDAVEAVLARADWVSLNAAEAAALTGRDDPTAAVEALPEQAPSAGVIVRLDRHGALLRFAGRTSAIPAYPVKAVDSNGAGDAHTGAFLAALAGGSAPLDAVALANRAAAFAVTRPGPATGPTREQLANFG